MISNEINILRDTFRRLLRRKANTNLTKLIEKTHPADMALLFRFFSDIEQNELFTIMRPSAVSYTHLTLPTICSV